MSVERWRDVITTRDLRDGAPVERAECQSRHLSPYAAYVCGSVRLRRLARVDRLGRADHYFGLLALDVERVPARGAR